MFTIKNARGRVALVCSMKVHEAMQKWPQGRLQTDTAGFAYAEWWDLLDPQPWEGPRLWDHGASRHCVTVHHGSRAVTTTELQQLQQVLRDCSAVERRRSKGYERSLT